MVLSLVWKDHMKGRVLASEALPFILFSTRKPVPSVLKMMVLSFSPPAIRGSNASKIPSSSESKPAFSYFQGVPVSSSRSREEELGLLHPARDRLIDRTNMVHFESILLIIFFWTVEGPPGLKLPIKSFIAEGY